MHLCEKYYKPITVQYYIANCVTWVPRLSAELRTNWTEQIRSWNRTHLYVRDVSTYSV